MDMGLIASWKALYRCELLQQLMADFENRKERRDRYKALMNGIKGLEEGFEPHILDVARLLRKAGIWYPLTMWLDVGSRPKVFPLGMEIDLVVEFGRIGKEQCTCVKELCSMISQVNLNTDKRDPF